jgi:hypothetical protein
VAEDVVVVAARLQPQAEQRPQPRRRPRRHRPRHSLQRQDAAQRLPRLRPSSMRT